MKYYRACAQSCSVVAAALLLSVFANSKLAAAEVIRIGIIGCDTSHVPAFTKLINDKDAQGVLTKVEVVAVYPDFSPDVALSRGRVEKFTEQMREMGVEVTDSVKSLLAQVDAVMIENVDGRKHLEHARTVFGTGKPVFIDKPFGGSLADVIEIFELAKSTETPCFTSSSFSMLPEYRTARNNPDLGEVVGCMVYGPCQIESYLPDLFWYGIHSTDILFAVMGSGCESVTRLQTEDAELVVGLWKNGNVGTYRGLRSGTYEFGSVVFGTKSNQYFRNTKDYGYPQIVEQIAEFFQTRKLPVSESRTLEIYAFMEAADESKRRGGLPTTLQSVIDKAMVEVASRRTE